MELAIRLPVFEGPLDLLLYLIDKNKVNIYDIPIVEITDQYMEYLEAMQKQDLNILSEFLVMAATLVDIKCRMLLPKDPVNEEQDPEDPREELVRQLLEHKMYKCMAAELKDMELEASRQLYRKQSLPAEVSGYVPPVDLDAMTKDLDLEKLRAIFESVLRRQTDKQDPIRSRFGQIQKEEISLEDRMSDLHSYAVSHRTFRFRQLLQKSPTRMNTIVTFLAILEMMKAGQICISQENLFDDILIESQIAAEEE